MPSRRSSSLAVRAAGSKSLVVGIAPGTVLGRVAERAASGFPARGLLVRTAPARLAERRLPGTVTDTGSARLPASDQVIAAGPSALTVRSMISDRSLTAISKAKAGQPAITRLITPSPAVATFATRLPVVPTTSAAHGSHP